MFMYTQQKSNRRFLSISQGVVKDTVNNREFSSVSGQLRGIYSLTRHYGGEEVPKWFIDMENSSGEIYTISFPYNSGTFKSVILSIASCGHLDSSTVFKITPWAKGIYTNVSVSVDGVNLDWIEQLPPAPTRTIAGRRIKDETEQMDIVVRYIEEIKSKVK